MAEVALLYINSDGQPEEAALADTTTFGGLTIGAGGDIALSGGGEVTGLPAVPSATAAASKEYVDSVAANLDPKESVRASSIGVGNVAIATDLENGDTLDGVTLATGDRVLIVEQTVGTEDGIYEVQASGAAVRTSDAQAGATFAGAYMVVEEGTLNADVFYVCTNDQGSDVVGTDNLAFVKFSSLVLAAGNGIDITGGNTIAVDLATISGLEFDSGDLRIQVADTNELTIDGSGLNVEGVPTLFNIGATAVGATVTAPNLDTLTDGSNADALHTHATGSSNRIDEELTANEAITAGDPVEWSTTADEIRQCRATVNDRVECFGVAEDAISAAGTGTVVRRGVCLGALTAGLTGGPAVANDRIFLDSGAGGGLRIGPNTVSGEHNVFIGTAKNANDLEVHPQYIGKRR